MKKRIKTVLSFSIMFLLSFGLLSSVNASAAKSLPKADGTITGYHDTIIGYHDIGARWFMSSYSYESTGFSVGAYLDGGASFKVNKNNNPYFQATHSQTVKNDPNVYRVTYQAIYASNNEVRIGVPFLGPISDIKVTLNINETNNFIFYIAGDGTNTYKASGKLYYGGI